MGAGKLLTTLVILVLNFVLAIFVETKLKAFFTLELVFVVLGMLLALILLFGIATGSRWAWPFGTIFFSLSLANAVFLFWNSGAWLSFVLLLLFNVFGLLMAVLSIGEREDEGLEMPQEPLQTYEEEASKQVSYAAPRVKTGAKKRKRR
jgi:hypothetical protein